MAATILTVKKLRQALADGLSIVSRIWEFKARNWVTCIYVADIDGDGDAETIIGSREGRIYCLSKTGKLRWKLDIGSREWIVTITVGGLAGPRKETSVHIIMGTRDGKVYVLDGEGRMVTRDGGILLFDEEGKPIDPQQALDACWFSIGYVIRSIYVDPLQQSQIILGTEDRCAYGLDYKTGEQLWNYPTGGWVRTVFAYDMNCDGKEEVLVGSADGNLYLLDFQGQLLAQYTVNHPIRTIFVEDVDNDGNLEVLMCTNHKNLVALTYCEGQFEKKWERGPFENRLLNLYVIDIDDDGNKEIISSCEDKHIYIFDASGNILWRHNHKYRIFDIATADIDNDGLPELLIGGENKRIRAMHVRLRRGVEERIRKYYRQLGKLDPETIPQLDADERALLQDVLGLNRRALVTFEHAREQIRAGLYDQALSTLRKLAQQKVERQWHRTDIEYIRTVCFRHTEKKQGREIIIGTADGRVHAFYSHGHRAWSSNLNDHIVDVQTGFISHYYKWEEIVIISSEHSLYILGGEKNPLQQARIADTWMSSFCVRAASSHDSPEIIIGSEAKKLFIYDSNLQSPKAEITTEEGVRIVRALMSGDESTPEIVVASMSNRIYAYKRNGKCLWEYPTHDHIKAVCIKDINGDGQPEILVGSEDRNIHVLDSAGNVLWRYYLPNGALTVDAADVDGDGMVEVFVGCADGNLYVFNRDGDLLWTYQASDRIHDVRIEDIDNDGNFEVALGSEDEFELLRVVNQQQIADAIKHCWTHLCQQSSPADAIASLFNSNDPFLQAFALNKQVEQGNLQARDFDLFEECATKGALEVRKELARLIPTLYQFNPARARTLLSQLWIDIDYEVRNLIIEHLPVLMNYDWEEGFYYLRLAAENSSRFVRRIAVRKVDELISNSAEILADRERRHQIFSLLLAAAQDKDSEWVRQEAAHTLALYLDQHQGNFIVYVQLFIVKNLHPNIWKQIAYKTTNSLVRRYINAVIPLLSDLDQSNVREKLQYMVKAQHAAENLLYGKDIHLIYNELEHLFSLEILEDISYYQCELRENQFHTNNRFAHNVLPIFKELSSISRPLKMYFRREDLQDRLNSLLEAIDAVERVSRLLDQQYSINQLGEPMSKLPDYKTFQLLFNKWKAMMQAQLNTLRGTAKLRVRLLTRDVRKEKQVGILAAIENVGRSSANDVKLSLLHSESFGVVGRNSFETEMIAAEEETTAEFVLKPSEVKLALTFEAVFDDAAGKTVIEVFTDCIELRDWQQEFCNIPNPYSTGTPTYTSELFYGREIDMAFLEDNLTRDVKTVIVLYGQRRSGKTSLLVQLMNSTVLGEHIPVLLDMQAVSYHATIKNFLRRVAHAIERAMRQKGIPITAPKSTDFEIDPIYAFEVFLDEIEERLVERKLILLIDEFEVLEEQVTKGRLQSEIFEYLRDIVQHRQNFNFLFSGTHKITEYTKWYRSVFFNIAVHHRLSRLTPRGAEDLIQKPVAGYLEYEPLTIEKIRRLTADQPYLIHLMCRAIVNYCNALHKNYVTINDVNIVQDEIMETGRYHFDWLWDQIKPEERVLLAAIAESSKEEGRWLPLTEIQEAYRRYRIPYKTDYLLEALIMLIEADIIESEQTVHEDLRKSRFRISVGLYRSWMLKEHPLDLVRKEMNG